MPETPGDPGKRSRMNSTQPIGIFDSGIGGLTVLKQIHAVLPAEDTIYLGDTARVPYGIRSPETVTRYSFENARFLLSRNIKLLVIACNTASSVSLEAIRNTFPAPVIGVIEPGAKAAARATHNRKIGIIGTDATIRSNAYAKAIHAADPSIEVTGLPCPLFVPLVEEGWTRGEIVELTAKKYLHSIKEVGIDTLVLGCTHYPLLKEVISDIMGDAVTLIDSAIETAKEIKTTLGSQSLLSDRDLPHVREFYVTDSPQRFLDVGERFLGERIRHIQQIKLEMEV